MLSSAFKCRPLLPMAAPFLISSLRLSARTISFPFASASEGVNNNESSRQAVFIAPDVICLFFCSWMFAAIHTQCIARQGSGENTPFSTSALSFYKAESGLG